MHPVAIITFLTAAVAAAPQTKGLPSLDKMTVGEAIDSCGADMIIQCCESLEDGIAGIPVISDPELIDDLDTGHQCFGLDMDTIGVSDQLLSNECQANAACCQIIEDDSGASVPCVALVSLP